MGFFNLKDPPPNDVHRRVRDVEGGAPIGWSSVTRGSLRIASEEGLLVEGSIKGVENNDLGIPAHIEWGGTANFTGDVKAKLFRVENGDFSAQMDGSGFRVDAIAHVIGEGSFPFTTRLGSTGIDLSFRDSTASVTPTGLKIGALPTATSPTTLNVVLVDSAGNFFRGPMYGGAGGPGGPGSGSGAGLQLGDPINSYTGLHWQGYEVTYGSVQCMHAYRIIEAALAIPGITRDICVWP